MDELLDHAPCGFIVFSDDGKIIEANTTLLNLLGYGRRELIDLHIEEIFSVPGRIFYQTHFFPLLKLKRKVEEVYLALRAKNGEQIPVLTNAQRRGYEGQVFNECVFVVMRQRNKYEDEILQAKKEAEAATRAKDEFLSVVSHELRTPLNSILGWSQILHTRKLEVKETEHAVGAILRSARAQAQLIEDLLDFARIISGKLRLDVERVDLEKVISEAIEVVSTAAAAKSIRLKTILNSNSFVSGSFGRLQQVLWNLLSNAIKFTPKGGRVEVKLERKGSSIEVSVSDNGNGIAPEFLPFVFERFRQADNSTSRHFGGLGLGLAITRHIVELHGGTIRAESDGEGLGATFTVSLPVMVSDRHNFLPAENKSSSPADETHTLYTDAPRLDGLNILVVDNEIEALEILTVILTQQGASVNTAASVFEALSKLRSVKPDLIVSDIEMPGEDGFSLIKKLRTLNEKQNKKIPAVALTAHARSSERMKILAAGFQVHLAKPIEPVELLTVIANLTHR